jgi:hypothetical protein
VPMLFGVKLSGFRFRSRGRVQFSRFRCQGVPSGAAGIFVTANGRGGKIAFPALSLAVDRASDGLRSSSFHMVRTRRNSGKPGEQAVGAWRIFRHVGCCLPPATSRRPSTARLDFDEH